MEHKGLMIILILTVISHLSLVYITVSFGTEIQIDLCNYLYEFYNQDGEYVLCDYSFGGQVSGQSLYGCSNGLDYDNIFDVNIVKHC